MASSSSANPSSQSQKKYDVFVSFRGEDTRFNFTSHLHEALRSKQIDTYIDDRLEKGDEVWPSLEKAIEDSTLFLVIFSENYASSTWCLKELAKILECSKNEGHLVKPVFYRVDPSHLRKQSGSYQKAFEQHEHKGIDKQQLRSWREALTYAANLSGWPCSFDRNEAVLIKEIVNDVIQTWRRLKYDVFISLRGRDTRYGFLSHLKKELRQKQIVAYVDERLESGNQISLSRVRAIKESLMSLVIFSKGYASSRWCLEELVQIIECMEKQNQIVIPVFYKIKPSDVRNQKGCYADAFVKYDKLYKEEVPVPIWKSALNKAANLSGFHSSNPKYKDEAELIEAIAEGLYLHRRGASRTKK